ncbi:hypothetical protein RFI_02882 [Reticulomyxa filosa]|uniref:Kelch motif family protein n=1 Tax=Reticulomyxa filosa TaxID=46433 RepID=X6P7P2_RETFI|nr:hypothetical protein RFI_02882 [Reticulomyxa filosa]|eukprot:ETO34211.1 hypothetical protein RFI_02882 [Reticulomyxa filosa]
MIFKQILHFFGKRIKYNKYISRVFKAICTFQNTVFVYSTFLKKSKLFNINNMSKQTFQFLKELPTPLKASQCVLHKHELLICGGDEQRVCYSYDILKNEYKFICEYPSDVQLWGHCVVKLVDNNNKDNNKITLLSFGGYFKHTLMMKYMSVWSNTSNKPNKLSNYNQWIPFKDNHNNPIIIGRNNDNYEGVRAVIGGSNNHLLFITYPNNISVFNLNTFQFIKHDTLPAGNWIRFHCFVLKSENGQEQKMIKTDQEKNKQSYQMLLFCEKTGLSIEYGEDSNTFQFRLPICDDIAPFKEYACVCVNDIILFFGGWDCDNGAISKSIHKYLISENKWIIFQNALPSPLGLCVAILNEEDNNIHIIGGVDDKDIMVSTHMKTKVSVWDCSQLVIICLFIIYLF